jgi:type I restriction-modification system DNA methylase subunit
MSEELFITREDLKDYIHSIHNFLRNNGAGYGAMGMKIFNVFYGLKLIQPCLDKLNLTDEQKKVLDFNELVKIAHDNKNSSEIIEYIDDKILELLYQFKDPHKHDISNNLGHFIFHQIPRGLKDNFWKEFIKKIEKIPVGYNKETKVNLSGKVYEYFVGRDKNSISELGAYFTDRHITEFIYNKLQPTLDDNNNVKTMIDPFGGSGGFTLGYAFYLRQKFDNINWSDNIDNIYHFDMEESVINMTGLEMFAITSSFPKRVCNYERVNSFAYEFPDSKNGYNKYHYVISNPPYGGDKTTKSAEQLKRDKVINYIKSLSNKDDYKEQLKELKTQSDDYQKNQEKQQVNLDNCSKRIKDFARKYKLSGNDKEACSLMLLADLVATNGTVIGVLKEGVFFNKTYKDLRKCLVENYNVREIISVPQDQFENTSTKTSIIIFDNTEEKTSEVKFYDLVVERYDEDKFEEVKGRIKITDNKGDISGITDTLMTVVTKEEILGNAICSLNGKDYNKKVIVCGEGYELVKIGDICEFTKYKSQKPSDGKFNHYTCSNTIKKCSDGNINGEYILIGTRGTITEALHYYNGKFGCGDNMLIFNSNTINNKYIYNILLSTKEQIKNYINGSTIPMISLSQFKNIQIPIPKSEQKIQEWVDKISKPYDEKNNKLNKIKELEEYVKNKIKDNGENEECEEVDLGSVCDLKDGYDFYRDEMDDRKQYIENENLPLLKIGCDAISDYIKINKKYDKYMVNKGDIVIGTKGTCGKIRKININKAYHKHGLLKIIEFKINKNYLYYLLLLLLDDETIEKMSNKSVLSNMKKEKLLKMKLLIPKNKQLIQDLEPTFDEIEKLQGEVKEAETLYKQLIKELSEEAMPVSATNTSVTSATSATSTNTANTTNTINIQELTNTGSDSIENNIPSSQSSTSSTSSIKSLHEQCKSLGIKGYSKYRNVEDKDKLLKLIAEHK